VGGRSSENQIRNDHTIAPTFNGYTQYFPDLGYNGNCIIS
jgi:hypothetical protein